MQWNNNLLHKDSNGESAGKGSDSGLTESTNQQKQLRILTFLNRRTYSNSTAIDKGMNENLYSAIIRNAEALGGKNVSHDAAKRWVFSRFLKSCQGVRVYNIVRQWVPNGQCSDRESPAGKNCSSSRNGQSRCVIRAVTEDTLVSMSILPCSIQFTYGRVAHILGYVFVSWT